MPCKRKTCTQDEGVEWDHGRGPCKKMHFFGQPPYTRAGKMRLATRNMGKTARPTCDDHIPDIQQQSQRNCRKRTFDCVDTSNIDEENSQYCNKRLANRLEPPRCIIRELSASCSSPTVPIPEGPPSIEMTLMGNSLDDDTRRQQQQQEEEEEDDPMSTALTSTALVVYTPPVTHCPYLRGCPSTKPIVEVPNMMETRLWRPVLHRNKSEGAEDDNDDAPLFVINASTPSITDASMQLD